jgi:TonB family protein
MASPSFRTTGLALVASLFWLSSVDVAHAGSGAYPRTIDAFVVRDKIHKDLPKINRCYESALRREPALEGKVSVRFAVIRTGYVKGVHVVENTTGNASVERCVTRVVSTLRFPRRRTGKSVRFTFPFVFTPQD